MDYPKKQLVPNSDGMLYLGELKRKRDSVCSLKISEQKRPRIVDSGQLTSQIFPPSLSTTASIMSIPEGPDCLSQQSEVCPVAASSCLSSTPNMSYSDLMDEPSPLGLSLRKSQSLIDLIQQGLKQNEKSLSSVSEQAVEENEKAKGMVPADSQQDKLKASNFPGCYIKIGKWECSSRYAGDLVAKFYYAKRKLVWEVLENGLKSKIEIQWSDISGIKANIPDKGPSSLHIEVSRPPLFFKETNPQPRKHTLWQSTTDFTGGNASFCCRHFLLFPEGVLNRHFDKLIQCDPCLKTLSERSMPFVGSPFFEGQTLMLDMDPLSQSSPSSNVSSMMAFENMQSEALAPFNYGPVPIMKRVEAPRIRPSGLKISLTEAQPHSPSSVMDARANEESSSSDTEDLNAKEKFAGYTCYKQSGPKMAFDHNILHGSSLVASSMDHGHLYPISMPSHTTLYDLKLFSDEIMMGQKQTSSSEKQFLEQSSLNLIQDKLHENIQANGQEFSAEPFQDRDEKLQERKSLSSVLSGNHAMVPTLTYGPFNNPSSACLVENLELPPTLKEKGDHSDLLHDFANKESYETLQLDESVSSLQKYMSCSRWSGYDKS